MSKKNISKRVVSNYDLRLGLKKVGVDLAIVLLSGLIVVWQNNAKYMALIPAIKFGLNYLKHKQ